MARVWLSHFDCASGRLPECCVVCGSEEDVEFVEREMEYRPSWPLPFLGLHLLGWHFIGAIVGLFTERYHRVLFTKLPFCADHYSYWERRDHRQHLGVLVIALGWLVPCLVTFVLNNNMRLSFNAQVVAGSATVVGLVVIFSHGFRTVHVAGVKATRVLIADVHADFVDAVEALKAASKTTRL